MKIKQIDTKYLRGIEVPVSSEDIFLKMSPYERDEWAIHWLVKNNIKLLEVTHLNVVVVNNCIKRTYITTYDYKEAVFR